MAKSRRKPLFDPASRRVLLFSFALSLLVAALRLAIPRSDGPPADLLVLATTPTEPTIRVLLTRAANERIEVGREAIAIDAHGREHRVSGDLHAREGTLWSGHSSLPLPSTLKAGREPLRWQGRSYRGDFVFHPDGQHLLIVNHVPMESYLEGVILEEMGHRAPLQALMAQAVASRSYALSRYRPERNPRYGLKADQSSQVYRGIPRLRGRAREAVESTRAVVVSWEGKVLEGLYSSTCGGWTRPASEAFGTRAAEPLDRQVICEYCRNSPTYRWSHSRPLSALRASLGLPSGSLRVSEVAHLSSGRSSHLEIASRSERRRVTPSRLRRAMGPRVRSNWITEARIEGDRLVVEGRGFGHGVGLCQYGARGQALAGRGWIDIIEHYYPGARLALGWGTPTDT